MRIDWTRTHKNIVNKLNDKKLPIKYDEVGLAVFDHSRPAYSDKTNPTEKVRQYYAEHNQPDITFCRGGYLVLSRWFPQASSQMSLLPPPITVQIDGDIMESFEAGFDCANRWPHMFDHYGDSMTIQRRDTRREGALVEAHVRLYFKENWPQFFREPSNKGQYTKAAIDDFSLVLPFGTVPVDAKQESYVAESGNGVAIIRKPKPNVLYIVAKRQYNSVVISGFTSGRWCQQLGAVDQALMHIESNHLWSIEALVVALNMARSGINYFDYLKRLAK